jgi:4'-phosphopantetheinyl transferase
MCLSYFIERRRYTEAYPANSESAHFRPIVPSTGANPILSSSRLTLATDRIDLWFVFSDEISDTVLLERYSALLSEEERIKESRFHFASDRKSYRITRALLRTVLSRYSTLAPQELVFSLHEHGKPHIANENGGAKEISFNLSHTNGAIALAVTRFTPVGIDVENVRSRQAPIDLAAHYFTISETLQLEALPLSKRSESFFELWTLKESFIKAKGKGLAIPLDHFSFSLRETHIHPSFSEHLPEDEDQWQFWQIRPSPDHVAVVCARLPLGPRQSLNIRKVVPLLTDESVEYPITRRSH